MKSRKYMFLKLKKVAAGPGEGSSDLSIINDLRAVSQSLAVCTDFAPIAGALTAIVLARWAECTTRRSMSALTEMWSAVIVLAHGDVVIADRESRVIVFLAADIKAMSKKI
jgi:hypothetical protein